MGYCKTEAMAYSPLFPYVDDKWAQIKRKKVTSGAAQHALTRIQTFLGFGLKLKLHSPRNFFTTCAGQPRFPLEEREKLGRWAKGSIMPDRYDRALCAAELRLRDCVITHINGGWRPTCAFEVPPKQPRVKEQNETSSCASTSESPTASTVIRKGNRFHI